MSRTDAVSLPNPALHSPWQSSWGGSGRCSFRSKMWILLFEKWDPGDNPHFVHERSLQQYIKGCHQCVFKMPDTDYLQDDLFSRRVHLTLLLINHHCYKNLLLPQISDQISAYCHCFSSSSQMSQIAEEATFWIISHEHCETVCVVKGKVS